MLNKPTLLPLLILPIGLFSAPLDFNREVRPILSDKCFSCHGPDEHGRKADLRLDLEREAKNPELLAIVEGKPEESEMIFRIHSQEKDEVMPPPETGKPLSAREKKILERWIREGAVWAEHWAYLDPVRNAPPNPRIPSGRRAGSTTLSWLTMRRKAYAPLPTPTRSP